MDMNYFDDLNTNLIHKTEFNFSIQKLLEATQSLMSRLQITDEFIIERGGYSLCLVHRANTEEKDRFREGSTALWDRKLNKRMFHESEFTNFNQALTGTYFETVYQEVQKMTNARIRRMRLLWLPPERNYAFHTDIDEPVRYHLALTTNENCFFIYKSNGKINSTFHIPSNGFLYKVNANEEHSFVNASHELRLHLVFTTPKNV